MARTLVTGNILRSGSIPTTALGGGVVTSSLQIVASLPTGSLSSSAQVNYPDISNIPGGIASSSTQIKNYLPVDTVSSSVQVTAFLPTGTVSSSTQLPSGIASSSAQVTAYLPTGTVSSSGQVSYTGLSNIPSGIASSSGQIKDYLPVDTVSSSQQVTAFLPANTVSSSGQISLSGISGTTFSNNNFSFPLNVTVNGLLTATSQSVIFITSSQLNVGSNDIVLNTTEQLRFGGLTVFDSGSANQSGSLFWDSLNNVWLYVHAGTSNTSSILITGPENTGVLGSEAFLTQNRVPKAGVNGDHIVDSQISDNGTTVGMTGNLSVTGSINAASVTASSGVNAGTSTLSSLIVDGNTTLNNTSGNTLIGTSTAAYSSVKLNIGTTSDAQNGVQIQTSPTGNGYVLFGDGTGSDAYRGEIRYNHNTDTFSIATANNTKLSIDSSGNLSVDGTTFNIDATNNRVGIGTSSPAYALDLASGIARFDSSAGDGLRIYGGAGTNQWDIYTNSTNLRFSDNTGGGSFVVDTGATIGGNLAVDTNTLYVDAANNRVGVGTASPAYTLDVRGQTQIITNSEYQLDVQSVNSSAGASVRRYSTSAYAYDVYQTSHHWRAGILGSTAYTIYDYTNLTDRLTILTTGNVGIGTTSPTSILNVVSATSNTVDAVESQLRIINTTSGKFATLGFSSNDTDGQHGRAGLSAGYAGSGTYAGFLAFFTRTNGGAFSERMRILTDGNVGIGTTNPSTKLHVFGSYPQVTISGTGGGGNRGISLVDGNATKYNFFVGAQNNVNNAFEITPSTAAGGTTYSTPAVVINSSGNVGIGTTNPSMLLHVGESKAGNTGITVQNTNSSYSSQIRWLNSSGTEKAAITYVASSDYLAFYWEPSGGNLLNFSGSNVGIGTTNPSYKLHVVGAVYIQDDTNPVLYLRDVGNSTSEIGVSGRGAGLDAIYMAGYNAVDNNTYDFRIVGANGNITTRANLTVGGALAKGSGTFRINHPLPEKSETHYLVHSFIEGPQADLIYRGKVSLINGRAEVNIDQSAQMTEGTFVLLCRDIQCFTSNETDWDAVRGSVSGNILTIECENQNSTATVSWMVVGERQDKHMYDTDWTDENGKAIVEPLKTDITQLETK